MDAWINRIGTALPPHDVHAAFLGFARGQLDPRPGALFDRMADRSGIAHRWSVLRPGEGGATGVDADGFYVPGRFPTTARRMDLYAARAPDLAQQAAEALGALDGITHLVVASCTGFMAPGLDQVLAARLGLTSGVQRTFVGFMGCYAAVPALRVAAQAVRADPSARVLVVALELCTLHLQESRDLEQVLSFLLFGDGAGAALVTAEPHGLRLGPFRSATVPDTADLITWRIGDQGFDMRLSGRVPAAITAALRVEAARNEPDSLLAGVDPAHVHWAVHAGGRTVLDAVATGLDLPAGALGHSRAVLQEIGNVSSATLLFVLGRMLAQSRIGEATGPGMALAFGPGLSAEGFQFELAA